MYCQVLSKGKTWSSEDQEEENKVEKFSLSLLEQQQGKRLLADVDASDAYRQNDSEQF